MPSYRMVTVKMSLCQRGAVICVAPWAALCTVWLHENKAIRLWLSASLVPSFNSLSLSLDIVLSLYWRLKYMHGHMQLEGTIQSMDCTVPSSWEDFNWIWRPWCNISPENISRLSLFVYLFVCLCVGTCECAQPHEPEGWWVTHLSNTVTLLRNKILFYLHNKSSYLNVKVGY